MTFGPVIEAAPAPPMTSRVQERKTVRRAADGYVPARHFLSQIHDALETARFNVKVRRLEVHRMFVIWSIEHGAWWRPGWMGYTSALDEAGRYTEREADEILRRANYVAINECKIPVAAVASAVAEAR